MVLHNFTHIGKSLATLIPEYIVVCDKETMRKVNIKKKFDVASYVI